MGRKKVHIAYVHSSHKLRIKMVEEREGKDFYTVLCELSKAGYSKKKAQDRLKMSRHCFDNIVDSSPLFQELTWVRDPGPGYRRSFTCEYQGREWTSREISEETGLSMSTIQGRIQAGWPTERLFSTELQRGRPRALQVHSAATDRKKQSAQRHERHRSEIDELRKHLKW